ncbi:protein-S-isoprenylcysteine O-methyltransferase [Talaromyces islandicus]|uniref:Protein-S-isoprenylcysteine O-methyltransferase n=1 Tax=Talaromyces islandicus TaxID=28573 RepID=A0A0U1M4N2_TALIS|nr:protein-S-isoprenylcysteine O-methyltransferase [Talaromyces islandicus]
MSPTSASTPSDPFSEPAEHFNSRNDSHEAYTAWRPPTTTRHTVHTNNSLTTAEPHSLDPSLLPGGKTALSGISVRAFFLGVALGVSSIISIFLAWQQIPLWRVPFFISSLCVFHFLEFWVTAQYNTRNADVSAYLLGSNGAAYNIAHGSAVVECLISHWLAPHGYFFDPDSSRIPAIIVFTGAVLMLTGQTVRTLAMATAAGNFNHIVQTERDVHHRLVTSGIYSLLRHPSYFGFFWWGLGTQLVLQNVVCFVGFTVVLWRFFQSRIEREEKHLVTFFQNHYVEYRKKTPVGIPFIV